MAMLNSRLVNPSLESRNYDSSVLYFWVNPIQDRGGRGHKGPHTSFFPVTSTNVRVSPQNFLTFSFNPFATLV